MNRPKYETELEVTQALVRREIGGIEALEAYKTAVLWQKHLKSLQPRFYRRPSGKPVRWTNYRPGYASKKDDE